MDFRIKCALQYGFSLIPGGQSLNYLFQRYVTRSLPISDEEFIQRVHGFWSRYEALKAAGLKTDVYFEFGAGWDLIAPLTFSLLGFKRLICIDLRPLIRPEIIHSTISRFVSLKDSLPFSVGDLIVPDRIDVDTLRREYRIEYMAPCNAAATGLPDGSVDLVFSNNVLEHIPEDLMPDILRECRRILRIDGFCDFQIDYQDHWSYFDQSIGIYNFLHYPSSQWRRMNPPLHYQNRLRHSDYTRFFEEVGFKIRDEQVGLPCQVDWEKIVKKGVAAEFLQRYSENDLQIPFARFILKKSI